jgi:L-alanine-DL-glutamate epimerase-like enolase superfamily enzyme
VSTTTIADVEVRPFRVRLDRELRWGASSSLARPEHVLVRVHLRDGSTGVAEALARPTIYGETRESIVAVLAHLRAGLLGVDARDDARVARVLGSVANNHTARGALDAAVAFARERSSGAPPGSCLAPARDAVRVTYILGLGTDDEQLAEARRAHDSGVRVLKVKVGREVDRDLAHVRRLRAELPGVECYVDCNELLDEKGAPRALEKMRDAGVLWVEEPLPVHRLRARAALKRLSILPIVADDSCFTPAMLEREIDFDTFDVLNVKPARTGVTDSLRMIAAARAAGKRVMIGSQAGGLLSTRLAGWMAAREDVELPSELTFFLRMRGDVCAPAPVLRDGWLDVAELASIAVDDARLALAAA